MGIRRSFKFNELPMLVVQDLILDVCVCVCVCVCLRTEGGGGAIAAYTYHYLSFIQYTKVWLRCQF